MCHRIVINIAGGHNTGVHKTTLLIKNQLEAIFEHKVKIIDLDELSNYPKQHTDKDYDFDKIIEKLEEEGEDEELVIILLCGCYSVYSPSLCKISSLKVFIDSDSDKRLINLIQDQNVSTSQELQTCVSYYMDHLRLEMLKFIEPSKTNADIIIPSANEALGIAIIVDGIVKIVEGYKGGKGTDAKKLFPQLDFNLERMEMEKERYYDLS